MKRWLWLAALPWLVNFSTTTNRYEVYREPPHPVNFDYLSLMSCEPNKKFVCDDFAQSLNDAHERRTDKDLRYRVMEKIYPICGTPEADGEVCLQAPKDAGHFWADDKRDCESNSGCLWSKDGCICR